ncbi:hypothetical protein WMY93_034279 [Mugilogobius chulae]|uniref:Uncharacterized protein n=1 Tax=Mugilogobius chulae TaxID=88201 RepID=A0AAW0MKU6_9GOBI
MPPVSPDTAAGALQVHTERGRTGRPRENGTAAGERDGPRENGTAAGERDGPRENGTAAGERDGRGRTGRPRMNGTARGRTGRPRVNGTAAGERDGPRRIRAMVTQNGTDDHAFHASTRTEGKKRQKVLILRRSCAEMCTAEQEERVK